MKRLLTGLVFLTALCGLQAAQEAVQLRLAAWNVRNYLDQDRWAGGQWRFDHPKPEEELVRIRRVLLEARPDILFLQEIGTDSHLRELQEDLSAGGLDLPYRHLSIGADARSGLGLLSRIAPVECHDHDIRVDEPKGPRIVRGIQEVRFDFRGRRLRAFHVHLKSRYTTDPKDPRSRALRTAELRLLRAFLDRIAGMYAETGSILVAGDFNTPFSSPMLDPLREAWMPVPVTDEGGSDWTYHHHRSGKRERIDGFWTLKDRGGEFRPAGLYPSNRDGAGGSDHRLVVIEWIQRRQSCSATDAGESVGARHSVPTHNW